LKEKDIYIFMFRNEFPKMYELLDQIQPPDSLNPFWKDFDDKLQHGFWRMKCRPYENALQSLDSAKWEFLKNKISKHLTMWDKKNERGQQQLMDMLNEVLAYSFLKRESGCSDIHFIPESKKSGIESPDLEGRLGDTNVICEIKTINISDDEAFIRREMSTRFCFRCGQSQPKLAQGFWDKLSKDLTKAKSQIEAYDSSNEPRHIVYIIINFDDMWEYRKEEYYQQIDDFLSKNIIQGIEIVFHNKRTVFDEIITMKDAIVFNEPEYS
jgi:hypothetical protein